VFTAFAAALPDVGRFWAYLNEATTTPALRLAAKVLVLGLFSLPGLTVLGGTIPALLRSFPRAPAARALAVSSFGNCAGYLAAVLVVLERSSPLVIVATLSFSLVASGLCLRGAFRGVRFRSPPSPRWF
jgi:spermidine synthase